MQKFCDSLLCYRRSETLSINAGNVSVGGDNPIRVQSMCNTDTNDTAACVNQAIEIANAGGELVRFTVQGIKEAENLRNIKEGLLKLGYGIPIIADIHFNPDVAMVAAKYADKIRINPGNFIDKRAVFDHIEYTEKQYSAELLKLEERFTKLLEICRMYNTALRIGVNHGSLSDRIMSRYGNTPAGMVESAMEFLRICRKKEFNDVVVSIKSSNVRIMIHGYRLLAATMRNEGMKYPLHLGVTEAGNAEDGRVKSAIGIGSLLADGIGDTIRVSLTEDPANEIPVGRILADHFTGRTLPLDITVNENLYSPYDYKKRITIKNDIIGNVNPPVVVASENSGNSSINPDIVYDERKLQWLFLTLSELKNHVGLLTEEPSQVVVLECSHENGIAEQRAFFLKMEEYHLKNPVIIRRVYREKNLETFQIKASADIGPLFIDGYGDGIWIENENIDVKKIISLSYSILQASHVRFTRTEYVACPGCGRTLFDIQKTLSDVKERTSHLKGLKIAVMGCIVNGPGEMADADYGYVGAGAGKITLYKNKEVIKKNVPESEAIGQLLELINKKPG